MRVARWWWLVVLLGACKQAPAQAPAEAPARLFTDVPADARGSAQFRDVGAALAWLTRFSQALPLLDDTDAVSSALASVEAGQLQQRMAMLGIDVAAPVNVHVRTSGLVVVAKLSDPSRMPLAMIAAGTSVTSLGPSVWGIEQSTRSPTVVWLQQGSLLVVSASMTTSMWDMAGHVQLLAAPDDEFGGMRFRQSPMIKRAPTDDVAAAWWRPPEVMQFAAEGPVEAHCTLTDQRYGCALSTSLTSLVAARAQAMLAESVPRGACALEAQHPLVAYVPSTMPASVPLLSSLVANDALRGPMAVGLRSSVTPTPAGGSNVDDWLVFASVTLVGTPRDDAQVQAMRSDVKQLGQKGAARAVGRVHVVDVANRLKPWRSLHLLVHDDVFAAGFGDSVAVDAVAVGVGVGGVGGSCDRPPGSLLHVDGPAMASLLRSPQVSLPDWAARMATPAMPAFVSSLGTLDVTAGVQNTRLTLVISGGHQARVSP
jgi:hypothetical protein